MPGLLSRRSFLVRSTALGSGLIGVMLSIPAIGFILSPLFKQPRESGWITVTDAKGKPVDLSTIQTGAAPMPFSIAVPTGEAWEFPDIYPYRVVYLVRLDSGEVRPLANICSHMQCNVHWDATISQFLCPCHGGLYDRTGKNIGGPPPSPLPQWEHRVTTDSSGRQTMQIRNRFNESI